MMRRLAVRKPLTGARPNMLTCIIILYGLNGIVNLVCFIIYISPWRNTGYMSNSFVNAYCVFFTVGLATTIFIGGPLIYWPYVYGSNMSPKARRNAACLGIVLNFIVHDFAMTYLEIYLVVVKGWTEIFLAISLFLTVLCFAIGFMTLWISYTWKLSKILQIRFGGAAGSHTLKVSKIAKADVDGQI
ncbi:hypothetical protein STCU_02982 [Strigomonas culicis]|uniref:Uncharacterized protein n=1 Tax=Strigomonas culicis TaxID=28005 RepID=S9UT90_9TRYP|nr:hypothetical protein STCU_02982 [Strigomonas culicis]|eukprot:EPY32088.1 hypothetical protein STCU_02982 [Strigomonas culicis]